MDLLFVRCAMSNFLLCAWFLVVLRKATFLGKLGTLGTAGSLNLTKLKNPLACKIFDTTISLILTYNSDEHITGVCVCQTRFAGTLGTLGAACTLGIADTKYKGGGLFAIRFTSYIKAYNTCDSEDTHQA